MYTASQEVAGDENDRGATCQNMTDILFHFKEFDFIFKPIKPNFKHRNSINYFVF